MRPIVTDRQGPVRILTLNRPEVRNALSRELRGALAEALAEAADDEATRAVVLTGAGDAFCAGLDLRELESTVDASAEADRADSRAFADLLLQLGAIPKPIDVNSMIGPQAGR